MSILIAITTCHKRNDQADAQRNTWALNLSNVRFFVGQTDVQHEGEIALSVDDSYVGLPAKVQGAVQWALDQGHDSFLKLDDDVYLVPSRLPMYSEDYVGNFRMRNGPYSNDYASGFCYYLSKRAMEVVANASLTEDTMEDRWIGQVLASSRIIKRDEKCFSCPYPTGVEEAPKLWGSNLGKECIAIAQYPAAKMYDLHTWYKRCFVDNQL